MLIIEMAKNQIHFRNRFSLLGLQILNYNSSTELRSQCSNCRTPFTIGTYRRAVYSK